MHASKQASKQASKRTAATLGSLDQVAADRNAEAHAAGQGDADADQCVAIGHIRVVAEHRPALARALALHRALGGGEGYRQPLAAREEPCHEDTGGLLVRQLGDGLTRLLHGCEALTKMQRRPRRRTGLGWRSRASPLE
eukprot:CAMPEP_0204526402 /NCGR_PEP_ID=MMETSP0661-20131031/8418_1 /ASSEMBLY_ACC=CAM_ASM_000606 /TAXON_ID=109239 /ORGANISM="Alexandrium margalefi, Strain AMGDE01CS-322" /LENGTH=138 /DNA_ID=CAMNT_0051532247 /DNA_START=390 /DNA_END=803 /DNA_ORIENTATION=-